MEGFIEGFIEGVSMGQRVSLCEAGHTFSRDLLAMGEECHRQESGSGSLWARRTFRGRSVLALTVSSR